MMSWEIAHFVALILCVPNSSVYLNIKGHSYIMSHENYTPNCCPVFKRNATKITKFNRKCFQTTEWLVFKQLSDWSSNNWVTGLQILKTKQVSVSNTAFAVSQSVCSNPRVTRVCVKIWVLVTWGRSTSSIRIPSLKFVGHAIRKIWHTMCVSINGNLSPWNESHLRWGTFLPNLGTLGLWVFHYVCDGWTDRRKIATLIAPFPMGVRHNNLVVRRLFQTKFGSDI